MYQVVKDRRRRFQVVMGEKYIDDEYASKDSEIDRLAKRIFSPSGRPRSLSPSAGRSFTSEPETPTQHTGSPRLPHSPVWPLAPARLDHMDLIGEGSLDKVTSQFVLHCHWEETIKGGELDHPP
jgi:hypothetical protein